MRMMKKNFLIVLSILLLMLSGCARAEPSAKADTDTIAQKDILIVYLTRTKNTEAVAKMIQQQVGGKLVSLELQNPYPENYQAIVQKVQQENETGFLPPLKTTIDNIENYDVVFIGFPTWGMRLPPPMKSFLNQYNLSGKTVVPFNTNGGYGLGSSLETIRQLCPNSFIKEAFTVKGGIERDGILFVMEGEKAKEVKHEVNVWLNKIGFQ